jgi:hypothetical protein
MEQALKDITSPEYIAENGKEQSIAELKKLDEIYATVYGNMPVTSGIERAFALSSVTRTSIIEALLKK